MKIFDRESRLENGHTEGLVDGQVCLDNEHGSSGCLGLLEDVSTTSVQDSVDTTDGVFWALKVEINHVNKISRHLSTGLVKNKKTPKC